MRESTAPLAPSLFPPPRACARLCVCESVFAGWLLVLVVVVGGFSGRTNSPRHYSTLYLNGLGLRCCLTVPLSTLSSKSDSFETSGVSRTVYRLSAVRVYGLTTQWLVKVHQLSLEVAALPR